MMSVTRLCLAAADDDRVGPELAHRLRGVGLPRHDGVDLALHQRDRHVLDRHVDELRLGDVELLALEPCAQVDVVGAALEVADLLAFHRLRVAGVDAAILAGDDGAAAGLGDVVAGIVVGHDALEHVAAGARGRRGGGERRVAELRLARLQALRDLPAARGQLDLHVEALLGPVAVLDGDEGRRARTGC